MLLKNTPTWLSASSVCSVYSVGPFGSIGPSIEGLDPNSARRPLTKKKSSKKLQNTTCLWVSMRTKGLLRTAVSEFKPKHSIDQKTSPSSGPGGVEASRSTEHRDSKGTLML